MIKVAKRQGSSNKSESSFKPSKKLNKKSALTSSINNAYIIESRVPLSRPKIEVPSMRIDSEKGHHSNPNRIGCWTGLVFGVVSLALLQPIPAIAGLILGIIAVIMSKLYDEKKNLHFAILVSIINLLVLIVVSIYLWANLF